MKEKSMNMIRSKCNNYVYLECLKYLIYVPKELSLFFHGEKEVEDYYLKKYLFLRDKGLVYEKKEIKFEPHYDKSKILTNLANLRQFLIEVTDLCNMKCRYCGYGDFYSNHDPRGTRNQTFENVKVLLDYLIELWKSKYNLSVNNLFAIGFYGGEPLLNMPLIKKIITYLESQKDLNMEFKYNMTTNSMLLDRYMDYLVEKKVMLLLSLDGDEYSSSYRLDKNGNNPFRRIIMNIHALKDKYPEYFDKNVSFNVVLHDRNSVFKSVSYIKNEFGKIPQISELNISGLDPNKKDLFYQMINSKSKSYEEALKINEFRNYLDNIDDKSLKFHRMFRSYLGNFYRNYTDLFDEKTENTYFPSGTCKPFEKKIYLTVSGKILPCEKIGQEYPLGFLKDGNIELSFDKISEYYSKSYEDIISYCQKCYSKSNCSQCFHLMNKYNGHLYCGNILTNRELMNRFSEYMSYIEENRNGYFQSMSNMSIE